MDLPVNTVKTRMFRGRKRLESLIEELAASPDQLESTLDNLCVWAARLRDELASGPRSRRRGDPTLPVQTIVPSLLTAITSGLETLIEQLLASFEMDLVLTPATQRLTARSSGR